MENNENFEVQQEQPQVEPDAPKTVVTANAPNKAKKPLYKKWWFWVIIGILVIALIAGGSGNDSDTDDNQNSSIDENNNNSNNTNSSEESNSSSSNNNNNNNSNNKKAKVTVSVIEKNNIPEDIYNNRYSDRVEFKFSIKNNESKDIKGIKGVLSIKDLFGVEIIKLNCNFTGKKISKGSSTTFSGIGIDINQFMDNHTKLYNEDYGDLKFEYEIDKIVYFGEKTAVETSYNEVKIKVVDKSNLSEDIYNGRYSPEVLFDFEITNKDKKSIKGIQGTLVVKDLFGDEIIKISCDFTGKSINPNQTQTFNDLSIEINEFIDSHLSLYNENYGDLNFEYIVSTIVYSDGTTIKK